MIMPRLTFEEPKGGPFAKAGQGKHRVTEPQTEAEEQAERPVDQAEEPDEAVEPTRQLDALFTAEEDEAEEPAQDRPRESFLLRWLVESDPSRREPNRDTVLVILKAVTVAAGIALVGLVVLLTTSGEDAPVAKAPSVPSIGTSHDPSAGPTTSTPDLGAIVAPPVHSQTTEMAPPPSVTQPTVPTGPTTKPGGDQNQFVRVGEPCDTQGAYGFTERYEPVVCDTGRQNGRLAWRRLFR